LGKFCGRTSRRRRQRSSICKYPQQDYNLALFIFNGKIEFQTTAAVREKKG